MVLENSLGSRINVDGEGFMRNVVLIGVYYKKGSLWTVAVDSVLRYRGMWK